MKPIDKLRFGTAGIPISTAKGGTENGIAQVRKLGLDSMELEFVRSVNIQEPRTASVKEAAKKHDILLSCHGQYYINLNSQEKAKVKASLDRVYKAAHIANLCGAWSMTFHAAYYMGQDPEKVYKTVKERVKEVVKRLKDEGSEIWVRPETTGKATQWGDIKEICRLSQDLDQVLPCIDFAHLHARTGGKYNTIAEFKEVLAYVEKTLGKQALKNMHIHMAGIAYSAKGEQNHLTIQQSDMNYKDLMKAFKDFKIKGSVISESPNIEKDASLMQKYYKQL
jgi:deoxyribonuclease-4